MIMPQLYYKEAILFTQYFLNPFQSLCTFNVLQLKIELHSNQISYFCSSHIDRVWKKDTYRQLFICQDEITFSGKKRRYNEQQAAKVINIIDIGWWKWRGDCSRQMRPSIIEWRKNCDCQNVGLHYISSLHFEYMMVR